MVNRAYRYSDGYSFIGLHIYVKFHMTPPSNIQEKQQVLSVNYPLLLPR